MSNQTRFTIMDSPLGGIILTGNTQGLSQINFHDGDQPLVPERDWIEDDEFFTAAISQLNAYFRGELKNFELILAPRGTVFQKRVWQALQEIPYGNTISYSKLAKQLGSPKATRAVGAANGRNPLPIVIPCHRVIGSNGKLTGYAGGLSFKQRLLSLESQTLHKNIQSEMRLEFQTDLI